MGSLFFLTTFYVVKYREKQKTDRIGWQLWAHDTRNKKR